MTREEMLKIMSENSPEITDIMTAQLYFGWSWKGIGFGECFLKLDSETGKWTADTECMGKESVRKFLHALADHIVDELDSPEAKD